MKRLITTVFLIAATLITVVPAQAATTDPARHLAACSTGIANFLGFESWDGCLRAKYGTVRITTINDFWLLVIPLIDTAVKIAAYMAVGFIIWGGIKYLKSQGDSGEVNTARSIIHNAVLGLLICILSVAIVQFVASGIR